MENRKQSFKKIYIAALFLTAACMWRGQDVRGQEVQLDAGDGEYSVEVSMTGGSGKASVTSPTLLFVRDGRAYAQLVWSSGNYDYMVVGGEKLLNENEGGYSTFTVPVTAFDEEIEMIADTTAMGAPHEITYRVTFYADSIDEKGALPQEAAKKVLSVACAIIVGGGILNYFVNKRRDWD